MLLEPGPIAPLDYAAFERALAPTVSPTTVASPSPIPAGLAALVTRAGDIDAAFVDAAVPDSDGLDDGELDGVIAETRAAAGDAALEPRGDVLGGMEEIDTRLGLADTGLAEDREQTGPGPFEPPDDATPPRGPHDGDGDAPRV